MAEARTLFPYLKKRHPLGSSDTSDLKTKLHSSTSAKQLMTPSFMLKILPGDPVAFKNGAFHDDLIAHNI